MGVTTVSLLSSTAYFIASLIPFSSLSSRLAFFQPKTISIALIAILLHGFVLYRWIDTPLGQNLSSSHVFSLVCWLICCSTVLVSFRKPIGNLIILTFPIAAGSILLGLAFPGEAFFQTGQNPVQLIHILTSLLALGLLGMAALQAGSLYLQNQLLRTKSLLQIAQVLPPLQTMEQLLFQIVLVGFILLSASLLTVLFFMQEFFVTAHLEKIIFSFIAWAVFASLLIYHYKTGLRGKKAIRLTLAGVGFLILAYLTSKSVHTGFIN